MVNQWPYDIRYDSGKRPGIGNRYMFDYTGFGEEAAFDHYENTSDYSYTTGERKLCDGEFLEW